MERNKYFKLNRAHPSILEERSDKHALDAEKSVRFSRTFWRRVASRLLPNRIYAHSSAILREYRPLGV